MVFNKFMIILLFCSIRCAYGINMKLIDKIKDFKISRRCCARDGLPIIYHTVCLYEDFTEKVSIYRKIAQKFLPASGKIHVIEIGNENEINELIKEIQQNNQCNYIIIFLSEHEEVESKRFIKLFMEMLEERNIDKVDIRCGWNERSSYFYGFYDFYIELYNNNLTVLQKKNYNDDYYIEKMKINSEFITGLVKDNTHLYLNGIFDPKKKELLIKYFLNYKLLFVSDSSLMEEEILLKNFQIGKMSYEFKNYESEDQIYCNMPDIQYINILFYFLKDFDILRNLVKRSLYSCESHNYSLFKEILRDLKIDFVDSHQIFISNTNRILIQAAERINEYVYLYDDICDKIRMLELKNDIQNYKRLLIYFYYCLKDCREIEVDELIEIVKEIIIKYDFKKLDVNIFAKLIQYITFYYGGYFPSSFYFDDYKDKRVYFS